MIIWATAALLGLATGLRIGWALVHKQSLVSVAMIVALGSLGLVAALNWLPLTLLINTVVHWPNSSVALSQLALISCAAGSCVMITAVSTSRSPAVTRRVALVQYGVAAVIGVVSTVLFFRAGKQTEMAPEVFLERNMGLRHSALPWLLPLLYVLMASTLVAGAGMRYSSRSRRGRALFIFSVGTVLIVLACAFFFLRAAGTTQLVGVGAAATLLGCAMLVVAAGALLPTVEDWFGARRELRTIRPLFDELAARQPDAGIGTRPRGPLAFRVAERMSVISDALYLEAIAADQRRVAHRGSTSTSADDRDPPDPAGFTAPMQARAVGRWILLGRYGRTEAADSDAHFPGLDGLRQPDGYSDRGWILAIADEYRTLSRNERDPPDLRSQIRRMPRSRLPG